ncbi:hypothetical protein D3C72_1715520 [compost metagenome]
MGLHPDGLAHVGLDAGVEGGQRRVGLERVHAKMRAAVRMLDALAVPLLPGRFADGGALGPQPLLLPHRGQVDHDPHGQQCQAQDQHAAVADHAGQFFSGDGDDHGSSRAWAR